MWKRRKGGWNNCTSTYVIVHCTVLYSTHTGKPIIYGWLELFLEKVRSVYVWTTEYTEWQWPLPGGRSITMEKSAQAGEGGGVHAHPLPLYLQLRTNFLCTHQLRGPIHSPYFYSSPLCTLWLAVFRTIHFHIFNQRKKFPRFLYTIHHLFTFDIY